MATQSKKIPVEFKGAHGLSEDGAIVQLKAEIGRPEMVLNGQSKLIPTGIYAKLPKGYCFKIYADDKAARQKGLMPTAGVQIVTDDRQIRVALSNQNNTTSTIAPGEVIAVMMLEKMEPVAWQKVSEKKSQVSTIAT